MTRCVHGGLTFEGRFKSIHVDKENYLIYLCRYMHRPLRQVQGTAWIHSVKRSGDTQDAYIVSFNFCKYIAHWPYSNYLECIEKRHGKLVDHQFMKSHFDRPELYQDFVAGDEENSELDKYLF